jgi:hypothetical protein
MVFAPGSEGANTSGKVSPILTSQPLEKIVKSKVSKAPYLRWGNYDTKGILSSGLNPFRKTRISLLDETESKKIALIIEPSCPGKAV